ncbi:MAG: hypothetical protein AAGF95_11835, partial [Chloroflexota bacterium]
MDKISRVLVTGATGNVGKAVLDKINTASIDLYAGVRDIQRAKSYLNGQSYRFCTVDFEKGQYPEIDFDAVFLVRPPQLTSPKIFETFLKSLKPQTKVVFLSVQGADRRSYLPHAKIEKLIVTLGYTHVFIRPSYFMENLTTTLWDELLHHQRIYLPAGDLALNWIAISDIAEVAAIALKQDLNCESIEVHNNITLNFKQVVDKINTICGTHISYESPSVISYIVYCLKQRKRISYIFIMLLLHYLPKFSKSNVNPITNDFTDITGKPP